MPKKHPQSKPVETTVTWQPEAIAEQLKMKVEPVQHPAHGQGSVFPIGPEGKMILEVFPDNCSVRLLGTNAELNLFRLDRSPRISKTGVVFDSLADGFSLHLVVTPDSAIDVAFGSFPRDLPKETGTLLRDRPGKAS
jgi:hypothetical protein